MRPVGGEGRRAGAHPRPGAPAPPRRRESRGFFTLWKKDEKVWIEIRPDQLDQPFFFGDTLASGLGEFEFVPGLLDDTQVTVFHRVGNRAQLIARNFAAWTAAVRACLEDARDRFPPRTDLDALATFVLTTMEGGVMQSRSYRKIEPFDRSVAQLRRYVDTLMEKKEDRQ